MDIYWISKAKQFAMQICSIALVDQCDCSPTAALCSATGMNRQAERTSRHRPFDLPALDKWAGRAQYRNDNGDSSAPVVCGGGGLKYEGRRKNEEFRKRQNPWP